MNEARTSRRWRARLAAVTLAAGLLTAAASVSAPAGTASAPAKAPVPRISDIGKYAVGTTTRTFVDSTRPTEGVAPNRTLFTAIYYPAQGQPTDQPVQNALPDTKDGPYPLILFSHGLGARGVYYQDVIKTWASAGYIVAAPDYPLSNSDAPGGPQFGRALGDTKNQPADASYVINQVLQLDKQGKQLGGIDAKRIGASGHSLGGITTYGLAFSNCCRDKRIRAAIPMSGLAGVVDAPGQYFHTSTPLLGLHGNVDGTVPYQAGRNAYTAAHSPKFLLTFLGAGHIAPFLGGNDAQAMTLKKATVDFWNRYLKSDKQALAKLQTDGNVPGSSAVEEQVAAASPTRTPASTTAGSRSNR
ncbi:MAG TPA: dienelactone hydrolase family protein [Acidimicrobiia bacterium]|nr:dienelactone hydrolase family protein [Acidimicrobiia bacterium]